MLSLGASGCFVGSINDAWAMLAAFALLGVLVGPFAWKADLDG
jgi:hypothetical protein